MAIDLDPKDVEAFLRANPNFCRTGPACLPFSIYPTEAKGPCLWLSDK